MSYYKIDKLENWLYRFYDPLSVNFYLIVGEEKAILFDTGYGVVDVMPEIRKITDLPLTVILSHGHVDHANGAFDFDEAWMNMDDLDVFKEHTTAEWRENLANEVIGNGIEGIDASAHGKKSPPALKPLEIGQIFDIGGLACEIIAMPGHTKGSVGLLIKEGKVLISADGASHLIWLFLKESAPVKQYAAMLESVEKLDFDYFLTGHTSVKNPKSDFKQLISVAKNASMDKAKPYDQMPELEGYIYAEGETAIVFSKETIK